MRKLVLLLAILLIPAVSKADTSIIDLISNVPALKQGVAFSLADSNLNYLSTLDVATFGKISIEAGYAGRVKETGDKLVAVVSYDLFRAKNYVTWPILQFVEFRPGIWAGVGRITGSNEFDYGVSATVFNLKF